MRVNKAIQKRAISFALAVIMAFGCLINTPATSAATTVLVPKITSDLSLGAAQGYNLVCFGNLTNGTADMQGKSFVGGKIDCPAGFTFGGTLTANDLSLVFGSKLQANFSASSFSSNGKALVYKDFITTENNRQINTHTFSGGIEKWNDEANLMQLTGIDLSVDMSNELLNDGRRVSNFQQQMIAKSQYLAALTATGTYNLTGTTLNLIGNKADINIFNISSDILNATSEIFIQIPRESIAVFNIIGDNVAFKNTLTKYVDPQNTASKTDYAGTQLQRKLLWNFKDATNLYFAASVHGSVLAPKADVKVTAPYGGNFEGTLVANNVTLAANFEGHNFPFSPPLTLSKTAKLVAWDKRTYDIKLSVSGDDSKTNMTIKDYIDPRFNVVDSNDTILKDGDTVAGDGTLKISGGTAYVLWENQDISSEKNWNKTFRVKARKEFIGGNNVTTNDVNSGVYNSNDEFIQAFPQPTVNVMPIFYIGNDTVTIFRGEIVPPSALLQPYTLKEDGTHVTGAGMYCGKDPTGIFTYVWKDANNKVIPGSTGVCSPGQYPENDTHYTLTATFEPYAATDASNVNSTLNGTVNTAVSYSATGVYNIYVVSGELDITKTVDSLYPAPSIVEAKQSFVFKIERRDNKDDKTPAETFYEVITPEKTGIKKITGLKKGYYTITEETDAWRYVQQSDSPTDNDDFIKDSSVVYIGRKIDAPKIANQIYYGAQTGSTHATPYPAEIYFSNKLTDSHWLGDTTVVVNTISH